MMLPGGPAAKLGHMYEKWWTLSELVRMLRGETDSMRLEPPGVDGVEFVVRSGNQQEFHQAKRSHPSGKRWSQATLASSGVLGNIGKLLIGNRDRFVFVSGSDARELADLCEAASSAESVEEFTGEFLNAQKRANFYRRLLEEWNCDARGACDVLRRIDVHTVSDRELETKVRWGLSGLFVDVHRVLEVLSVTVDDAVYRTIARGDLVDQLARSGYVLRKLLAPQHARQAIVDATDKYLKGACRSLIQESLIPRRATSQVVARLSGKQPSDCVLTGRAGTGKTGCVIEVVEELRKQGVHVLVVRMDRHMSATSPTDLGHRLDLEESPALLLAAAANADDASAVLIVDQLDAVSAMSGRSPEAFGVVQDLLIEAKDAAIATAVVCRTFDWQHDPHLRSLIREDGSQIPVDELFADDVHGVLAKAGFDSAAFGAGEFALLRLPWNLSLFLGCEFDPSHPPSFTASGLLERYWDTKRKLVGARAGGVDQWIDVMDAVCESMSKTQQLSVRKEKLDQISTDYLDQCVSENVLVAEGNSYAFGHESFFDYCFARLFASKEESLATVLTSSEQHLFRRAQVRQVLAYLRGADFERYATELRTLVSSNGIRTHVKDLVFALLAAFDDPHDEEWDIWMAYVEPKLPAIEQGACEDRLIMRAWRQIFYAKSWFKQFDKRGMIAEWLKAGGPTADLAIECLSWQQRDWPDRVAEHLEPYVDRHGDWTLRLQNVLARSDYRVSRRQFDLFLRLLERGVFDLASDSRSGHGAWEVLWKLGEGRPEWVPEVVARVLRLYSCQVQNDATRGSWDDLEAGSASEAIDRAAKRHPLTFVDHILPAVLEIAEAAPKIGSGPPVRDAVWPYLTKDAYSLADSCLVALTEALCSLARTGINLREQIDVLVSKETYVANHLLLAIYRGGARHYADEAALAFCHQAWRFDCGYSDSSYWCATETLRAVVPHCKPPIVAKLESVVLAYIDPYEKKGEGVRFRGWASINLLATIPAQLRGDHANRRFQELQRKFHHLATEPKGIVAGFVGSPIAQEKANKMSDDAWRGAIATHSSDGRGGPAFKDGQPRGGAVELAPLFRKAAQEEPQRFARLGLQLSPKTNPVYFSALLGGLTEATLDEEYKVAVCQRVFEYARVECGRDIAKLLATANRPLPDGALDILVRLAIETEGSEDEKWWLEDVGDDHFDLRSDIYTKGINTTRGRAALSLGELISKDGGYISRLEPVLSELVGVRSAAIGSCVAYTLRTVAYHDQALGVGLFLRMDFSEERLLGTRHVHEFVRENVHREFAKMRGLIVRMLRSPYPDVRRPGARLGCLAAFSHQDALELAEESRRGDIHQRRGGADVAAVNIGEPECRPWCESALRDFFADDDPEVRKVAASCFRHIHENDLATCGDLIGAFCNNPAFEDDSFSLLRALKNARAQLPGMTHLACERLLKRTERLGTDTMTAIELVFRLYQQHPNDKWTKRCLDLIDLVCLEEPGHARSGFDDFER